MTKATPLSTFRISYDHLETNEAIKDAYTDFLNKRDAFGEAAKDFKQATKTLHELLDGPLRSLGHIPDGKDWTLKEDEEDGLFIHVWSEPRQRGRRRPAVPMKELSFD